MSEELKRGILGGVVTGHFEMTEEEKIEADKSFEKILREVGVLGENETIKDIRAANEAKKGKNKNGKG